MLLKEKKRHHEELIAELEEVILPQGYQEKDQSMYLIDYLYGYSDVHEQVETFLEDEKLDDKWIIFYRCLLNSQYLKGKYNKYREIGKTLFLIRDENDLIKLKQELTGNKIEESIIKTEIENLLEKTKDMVNEKEENKLKTIEELFLEKDETKAEVEKLLEKYLQGKENKNQEEVENIIFEIDKLLIDLGKKKKIRFTKTDFMTKILELSNEKLSKIKKQKELK